MRAAQRERECRDCPKRDEQDGDQEAEGDEPERAAEEAAQERVGVRGPLEHEHERGEDRVGESETASARRSTVGPKPAAAPVNPSTSTAVAAARAGRSHTCRCGRGEAGRREPGGISRGAIAYAASAIASPSAGGQRDGREAERDGEEREPAGWPRR